jgi:putative hemolysin
MEETNIFFMVIFLLVLLGFSAFFSGSETALMAISKLRLRHLAESRPRRARLVERVLEKPERLIGTILLGNNLVNVAISAIATAVAISIWGNRGIVYATGVLTLVILIFAEITPKVYAKYFNEPVSFITAPILSVIMIIFHPFVFLVTYISKKILHLMGVDVSKIEKPLMTEAEIHTCIRMGWDEGAITAEEQSMLSRVFMLNDKTVGEVMVPKEEIITVDSEASTEEIYRIILHSGHTRFPVRAGRDEEIIGFIHAKDLFHFMDQKKTGSIKDIIRLPYFVQADRTIDAQLRGFQKRNLHQAVVLDAEGKVTGLITLEDILEELVGSIQDEHD